MTRRSIIVVQLVLGGLGIALYAANSAGLWALRNQRKARELESRDYGLSLLMARPVVTGSASAENAALWYRKSLTQASAALSADDRSILARDFDDLRVLERQFRARCPDPEPILHAARCANCDWGIHFQAPEPIGSSTTFLPARFLAYCLAEATERRRLTGPLEEASAPCLSALRFAADLRLTDLFGGLIAVDVARAGLAGLGTLLTSLEDREDVGLEQLDHSLAALEPHVLGLGEGPRVERLEYLAAVESEAQEAATRGRVGGGRFLPWDAITAARLHRVEDLMDRQEESAALGDPEARMRMTEEVRRAAAKMRWSQLLSQHDPPSSYVLRQNGKELEDRYRMVRVAVWLERWRGRHERFPSDLVPLQLPFPASGLRYEVLSDGQSYRLQAVSLPDSVRPSARLVLERLPTRQRAVGGH